MINSLVDIVVEQKNTKKDTQAEAELDLNNLKKDETKKTDKTTKDGLLKEISKKDETEKTDKTIKDGLLKEIGKKDTKVENKIDLKSATIDSKKETQENNKLNTRF